MIDLQRINSECVWWLGFIVYGSSQGCSFWDGEWHGPYRVWGAMELAMTER
jgi:hypothetical protein